MRTRHIMPRKAKSEPMITSVSLRDFCCIEHALKACERAWGVKLVVGVVLATEPSTVFPLKLTVCCIEPVHQAELNGFPGVIVEMYNTDLVPYEVQAVSALLEWVCRLEEHMKS